MWMHVGSIGRVLATCRREDQGVDLAYDLLIESPGTGRELDGRKVY